MRMGRGGCHGYLVRHWCCVCGGGILGWTYVPTKWLELILTGLYLYLGSLYLRALSRNTLY